MSGAPINEVIKDDNSVIDNPKGKLEPSDPSEHRQKRNRSKDAYCTCTGPGECNIL